MNLPTALSEMADMLLVAAQAASDLAEHHREAQTKNSARVLLAEVSEIAGRLKEIGREIEASAD